MPMTIDDLPGFAHPNFFWKSRDFHCIFGWPFKWTLDDSKRTRFTLIARRVQTQ